MIFQNENNLFRVIQLQFNQNGGQVSYAGEYTLPEHNVQNTTTNEGIMNRYQKDRTRIQGLVERMWRMTGFRFTYVQPLTEAKRQFSIEWSIELGTMKG